MATSSNNNNNSTTTAPAGWNPDWEVVHPNELWRADLWTEHPDYAKKFLARAYGYNGARKQLSAEATVFLAPQGSRAWTEASAHDKQWAASAGKNNTWTLREVKPRNPTKPGGRQRRDESSMSSSTAASEDGDDMSEANERDDERIAALEQKILGMEVTMREMFMLLQAINNKK